MKKFIIVLHVVVLISCAKKSTRFERLGPEVTGIDFVNSIVQSDSFNIMRNEYMYNGGGVGIGDFNNDGLADVVFTGNQVTSRIYLNLGDFKFRDITSSFKNLSNDQWYSGVSVVDINADQWLDVYLTSTTDKDPQKRKNRLWVNQGLAPDGTPSFLEMSESYGIADDNYTVHSGFFDYDLDGDLDLYVLNNIVNKNIPTNYRPKITDGSAINNDKLYRNEGGGKFTDVTIEAGITYEGFGLGLAFGDVNKDGYPDIYVSNDYISNDLLYINQGNGTFRNESRNYLSYQSKFSMGNDMADINNDGNPDIITLDMMPEQYFRKKQTINGHSYFFYVNDEKFGYEHQYVRNMLHLHNGFRNGDMLPYSEVAQMMGVFQTEWSWSPLFADYDNDGDKDLLITNGFPKDLTDKDFTNYKAQVYGSVAGDEYMIGRIPVVKVSNYAFENKGNFQFANQTAEWGMEIPSFSNGAAFADLDNDGDLDYLVNNIDDVAFVYRNNTIGKPGASANYLKLKLTGKGENTMAIGAKVELWNGGTYQFYEHFLTRGYISSVDPVIHFGLEGMGVIDSVKVTWPKIGYVTILKNITSHQVLAISEQDSQQYGWPAKTGTIGNSIFEERNDAIAYRHTEEDYVDFFQSQRIIQHKLSQIGPCMAKGDLDGDGTEDLVIGASDRLPTTVFLFKGGHFVSTKLSGLTEKKKCTESDLVIFDTDGDGDNDLISSSGGYANEDDGDYLHFLYQNNGGSFTRSDLPLPPFPASVVRPFDYDHDGDMDLFVGARVKKGAFPLAPVSYLLKNDGGKFSTHKELSFDLGMVTDAAWSDYNGDGWQDIVIAREWNSVTVLQNNGGKGFGEMEDEVLKEKHGLWSSISAGDLDGDGDDDYIIGNLGENHRFNVGDELPLRLYGVDVDNNGFIDPVTTAFWKDKDGVMREYPVNYLDELAAQSPFFRKKYISYTKFSYATIDSIIDRTSVPAERKFYVNSTSSFILWNAREGARWERLPSVVQTAPVKKIMVRDFNGDSHLDVLIGGNDYAHDVSTGNYDANKGILLLGSEDRTFDVLPASSSGLLLRGQVASMLFFEGDSSLVVGINRDTIATYRLMSGRRMGAD